MMLDKDQEKVQNEYFQWLKDTGKAKYELTDVFVNNNGETKKEKKMAWIVNNSPEYWREFCEVTGREYEGEVSLLAIY